MFIIIDELLNVYGKYDEEHKANRAIKSFSQSNRGVKFHLLTMGYSFYTPTLQEIEQSKTDKHFWS